MDIERAYIIRLLQEVQSELKRSGTEQGNEMDKLIQHLAAEHDIRSALRSLYRVRGFDQFALTLLWLVDSLRVQGSAPSDSVIAYEARNLVKSFPYLFQSIS